jgi:hypothetical protein
MFPCDPEFVFTERMKINMSKEAYEGLEMWLKDVTSGMLDSSNDDEKAPVLCKFCGMAPCFVDINYEDLFVGVGTDLEELGLKNKEIRHGMYHEAFRLWKGHVGAGICYKLPHCITSNIHDAYPEANGDYVGFKKGTRNIGDDESKNDIKTVAKKRPSEDAVEIVAKKAHKKPFGYPCAACPYGMDYFGDMPKHDSESFSTDV